MRDFMAFVFGICAGVLIVLVAQSVTQKDTYSIESQRACAHVAVAKEAQAKSSVLKAYNKGPEWDEFFVAYDKRNQDTIDKYSPECKEN